MRVDLLRLRPDGSTITTYRFFGGIGEQNQLSGHYEGPGDSGTFVLESVQLPSDSWYAWPLHGQWVLWDANQNVVATYLIDVNDQWSAGLNGSDVNGCTLTGVFDAWSSAYTYNLNVGLVGCTGAGLEGDFFGMGVFTHESNSNTELLRIALRNDQVAFELVLRRP